MNFKDYEDLTKCFFCKNFYQMPKILPCGFSICSKCCDSFPKITCNYCSKEHYLNGLVTNQSHLKLLKLISESQSVNTQRAYQSIENLYDNESTNHKINFLNNEFKYIQINLNALLSEKHLHKSLRLLNRNSILVVEEKYYGKISTTSLKLVNKNGLLIKQFDINNHLKYYVFDRVYDKYILVVFRQGSSQYYVHLYDSNLNFLVDKEFEYEIKNIVMGETSLYIMANGKNTHIREFSYELVKLSKFGQIKNEKKKFYIKGEVFMINNEKVFMKYENEIIVMNRSKGDVVLNFNVDNLKMSKVFFDSAQNYLVYDGFSKLSLYDQDGNFVISKKLKYHEKYDQFQLTSFKDFVFVNNEKNIILII
ncbi:unnamed protein product [Brachionus calyciflorus]|uniref:RING-type domain-containing protein n=1 Tax=Brachionus calyciflorus TaxID=104777 RepID=A0A813VSI3_9BILA|nr:unnamed protein product [Brachionus calyciflorus]